MVKVGIDNDGILIFTIIGIVIGILMVSFGVQFFPVAGWNNFLLIVGLVLIGFSTLVMLGGALKWS